MAQFGRCILVQWTFKRKYAAVLFQVVQGESSCPEHVTRGSGLFEIGRRVLLLEIWLGDEAGGPVEVVLGGGLRLTLELLLDLHVFGGGLLLLLLLLSLLLGLLLGELLGGVLGGPGGVGGRRGGRVGRGCGRGELRLGLRRGPAGALVLHGLVAAVEDASTPLGAGGSSFHAILVEHVGRCRIWKQQEIFVTFLSR